MKYPVGKTEAEGDFDKFQAECEEMRKRLPGRQLHAKDHFQPDKVPVAPWGGQLRPRPWLEENSPSLARK